MDDKNIEVLYNGTTKTQQNLNVAFCEALKDLGVQLNNVIKVFNAMTSFYETSFENMALDMAITAKTASKLAGISESKINKDYKKGFIHKVTINGKRGFSKNEIIQKYQ